jgi:lipopolysaccharide transport system permease protein
VLAALNVRYRDVKYTIPFVTQIWMFLTPIIYPSSYLPEKYRIVMTLNPLTGIVEGFRASLVGGREIDWGAVGASGAVTVIVFAVGLAYFRRTERVFADIV